MTGAAILPRLVADAAARMRNVLAFFLIGAFIAVLPVLALLVIPAGNKDIVTYMVGQLSGMATMVLSFYFTNKVGQDAVEAKRVENTGKMADAITAVAAVTGTPNTPKDVNAAADKVAGAAVDAAADITGVQPLKDPADGDDDAAA